MEELLNQLEVARRVEFKAKVKVVVAIIKAFALAEHYGVKFDHRTKAVLRKGNDGYYMTNNNGFYQSLGIIIDEYVKNKYFKEFVNEWITKDDYLEFNVEMDPWPLEYQSLK